MEATDETETLSLARIVRDSALLLAASTGLLYLTSHLYGAEYLKLFGVEAGFHGIGLAHLAMLSFGDVFLLLLFGWILYATFLTPKFRRFVAGLLVVVAVIASRLLTTVAYDGAVERKAINAVVFGLIYWGGLAVYFHARIAKAARDMAATLAKAERSVEAGSPMLTPKKQLARWIADGGYFLRRLKVLVALTAGYSAMVLALPTLVSFEAIEKVQAEDWRPMDANAARVPVYWIGDRLVYITFDSSGCKVHVQIAGVEQARRKCPRWISDVTLP